MNEINESFCYFTHADGTKFQVLVLDEAGGTIDTDQEASMALLREYSNKLLGGIT